MVRLTDYGWLLRDRRRIEAFSRALAAAVSPSAVVLDLGTGLGTFSILACMHGCARAVAVEPGSVIALAREHALASGFADRIEFLQARATEIELPERVDVIVSDLSGALPLFEDHLVSVIHTRDRFLKPGGTLIPQRDRLMCAPVRSIPDPWSAVPGIDFTAARTMALSEPQAQHVEPADLAAEPRCWAELDYATIATPDVTGSAEWASVDGEVQGFALWFESTLHGEITYSSGPWFPESVHATMVLPLLEPLRATNALRLTIEATHAGGRYVVRWRAGSGAWQTTRAERSVRRHRIGEQWLLIDDATGAVHLLNETGARVWDALQRGDDPETIAAALARDYEVDGPRASADVAAIVLELRRAGLMD